MFISANSRQGNESSKFDRGTLNRPLRVVIADPDKMCRQKVKSLLAAEPNVQVVAECTRTQEIHEALRLHKPDLLLLEPRMPGGNPFDILIPLSPESLPSLIFITAQDQYAVKAFESEACDYIMKPFDQARFRRALRRARVDAEQFRGDTLTLRQSNLIREVSSVPEERLIVKTEGRIVFLELNTIEWIEAAANYVAIHVGSDVYRLRQPISRIEKRVASHGYSRIHRSVIVNLRKIKEVFACNSGEYMVRLKNGKDLPCSRNYNSAIHMLVYGVKAGSGKE